ncbi:chlorophyll synthesis pathway protein BchC [Gemmatimonadetes bacterium T265]|nr:chlorophyll synthesis pathway protein BchC [Gemmatimonadetes bacterium T265]
MTAATTDVPRAAAYDARTPAVPFEALAVVLEAPGTLSLRPVAHRAPGDADAVVEVEWTGISAGTERLFWRGTMPQFPGLRYPLIPGYETVGRVVWAGPGSGRALGDRVFVPGAYSAIEVANLFGGACRRLVAPGARLVALDAERGAEAILLALAATALHAVRGGAALPDLIVGHGTLGRLAARLVVALGGAPPTVWEVDEARRGGAAGYPVLTSDADARRDYACVCELSGSGALLDALIGRLAKGGEVVLAGFYAAPLTFEYVPAFMREARVRVAAGWAPEDLADARALVARGALSLGGIATHAADVSLGTAAVRDAYATAFDDPACIKMILDWRSCP